MSDTIAAICTAPGKAAISIVRVSGPEALSVADAIFRCSGPQPSERPANSFVHGFIHSQAFKQQTAHHDVDEVILLVYRAPRSYTREDVVELQGHGGLSAARRILAAALGAGARMAGAGEFTRRAFLNGRLDLIQAEAVMDLIQAESNRAAMCAVDQINGHLSNCITTVYNEIMNVAADLEAVLDFTDDEVPEPLLPALTQRLEPCVAKMDDMLSTWREGRLLREGAVVVISGRPNVGKSSLLNRLLGAERAIVTDMPGTTRDTVEESLILHGVPIRLVDTAGLRTTDCRIEQAGITRSRDMLSRADLTLYLLDAREGLAAEDREQLATTQRSRVLLVLNKCDLISKVDHACTADLQISAATGDGIDLLKEAITDRLGVSSDDATGVYISERHRAGIATARERCAATLHQLSRQDEELIVTAAAELRAALESLGEILGKNYNATLLDTIFNRFCIGK